MRMAAARPREVDRPRAEGVRAPVAKARERALLDLGGDDEWRHGIGVCVLVLDDLVAVLVPTRFPGLAALRLQPSQPKTDSWTCTGLFSTSGVSVAVVPWMKPSSGRLSTT